MNENQFGNQKEQEAWEFVKRLGELYEQDVKGFEGICLLNPLQAKKLETALSILKKYAEENDVKLEMELNPSERHGFLSVKLPMIDVYGESLKEFKELISCVSVFGVNPTADGELLIDININDVWRRV